MRVILGAETEAPGPDSGPGATWERRELEAIAASARGRLVGPIGVAVKSVVGLADSLFPGVAMPVAGPPAARAARPTGAPPAGATEGGADQPDDEEEEQEAAEEAEEPAPVAPSPAVAAVRAARRDCVAARNDDRLAGLDEAGDHAGVVRRDPD